MKKKTRFIIGFFSIFLTSLLFPLIAKAQEDQNFLGIINDPAIIITDVDPGQLYETTVNLTHNFEDESAVTFIPDARPFIQSGETGSPEYLFEENLPDIVNAAAWVEFGEEEYALNAGDTKESSITIQIPDDVDPGGYYVALIYGDNPEATGEAVSVSKNIVSLVFLTVRGDAEQDGSILDFTTDRTIYEFMPVNFSIRYENKGSVHQLPGGNVFIHRGDISNPIGTIVFNEEQGMTLPGSVRAYSESFTDGFLYYEDGRLKMDQSKFPRIFFGEYTATLKFKHTVNGERITAEKEVSFWIIPWKLILLLILLIVGIILLIRRIRKKRKEKYTASARRFK